ncbi:MAG: hypothetical protein VX294_14450 [Candidatus Latescibacterota bacterium]|nr:hypothetical protein [Candidatus Latescibacterota bacterium]
MLITLSLANSKMYKVYDLTVSFCLLLFSVSCGALNPTGSLEYQPSRLSMGPLTIGTWLPAGMNEFRFIDSDQELLVDLGVNSIQWIQRYSDENGTAEEQLMAFASGQGWHMPVYFEPSGWTAYDKLQNWATKVELANQDSLRDLVQDLYRRWKDESAFSGYLVGHEDYNKNNYLALSSVVQAVSEVDPTYPSITVGRLQDYQDIQFFLEKFFDSAGDNNIFQHEHYVFRGDLPSKGSRFQRRIDDLVSGYNQVMRGLEGRSGRWHAIVQVQSEERNGRVYYRKPSPSEVRMQVGLALSRGASGIIYFLYSSGVEELADAGGNVKEVRVYEGIVDQLRMPTSSYFAIKQINRDLAEIDSDLRDFHFHGALSSRKFLDNKYILSITGTAEVGLLGDQEKVTHLLVVNRWAHKAQKILLKLRIIDDTGKPTAIPRAVEVSLAPGGFTLMPF